MAGKRLFDENAPPRSTLGFVDFAKQCEYSPPSYWTTNHSPPTRDLPLINAGERSREALQSLVDKTWDPEQAGLGRDASGLTKCDIEVVDVHRLENAKLFRGYFLERQKLFKECSSRKEICRDIQKLPGSGGRTVPSHKLPRFMKRELYWEVNEHYLFHGTKDGNIQSILSNGLDPNRGSTDGMFGQAVYMSESFTKSDQYTDSPSARSDPGTDLYMILARVLLGRVYVCHKRKKSNKLRGPPCTCCEMDVCKRWFPHSRYDSVMADGQWMFREFAVYHKNRCYPEYLIKYRRKQEPPPPLPLPPPPPPPPPPPTSQPPPPPSSSLLSLFIAIIMALIMYFAWNILFLEPRSKGAKS